MLTQRGPRAASHLDTISLARGNRSRVGFSLLSLLPAAGRSRCSVRDEAAIIQLVYHVKIMEQNDILEKSFRGQRLTDNVPHSSRSGGGAWGPP